MANNYKRWLCEESLKTSSSRPILIYFEFRSKPSLITVICMDPHSPNKLFATKYCFLVLGDDTSFFFFLSLFFGFFFFCYFTLLLTFKKILLLLLLLLLFHEIFFSGMFRDFPECSGIFRNVPRSGVLSTTAAWLAQLGERRSTEWEVAGSNPGRTNTQGL